MLDGYRDDLAYIHDQGFGDFARNAASLVVETSQRNGVNSGLVVDLGCGSGVLAERVVAAGYDVLGIDLSPALVDLARRRVPTASFRVESLLTAKLPRCVAVTAVGECVNYLFDRDQEVHRLRLYPSTAVAEHLRRTGFHVALLRSYGSLPLPSGLVGFAARKAH